MLNKNSKNVKLSEDNWITSRGIEFHRVECGNKVSIVQKVKRGQYKVSCHTIHDENTQNHISPLFDFNGMVIKSTKQQALTFARRWVKQ